MTPIYVHDYLLKSGTALNAVSQRRVFAGALICVNDGYGCVHPWPEFGDAPVEEQLRLLAEGITTPVTEMALQCAAVDGEARLERLGVEKGVRGLRLPERRQHLGVETVRVAGLRADAVAQPLPVILGGGRDAVAVVAVADLVACLELAERLGRGGGR